MNTPRTTLLQTPALPLLVGASVFDAFAWCRSTELEWRVPEAGLIVNPLDAELPLRLAFVFREPWPVLPAELARLHTGRGYHLTDELALAPYAIDDATDQLFAHRRTAHETFWLAADNLNALFWGLHDWVHFHNHGAFEQRTATEFQCDVSALVWLHLNRERVPLERSTWNDLVAQTRAIHHTRAEREPPLTPFDATWLDAPERLIALAASLES